MGGGPILLIGLAGRKGSGKDTAGAYLMERYGFVRASFAAPLKDSAAALFDVPVEVWESAKNDPTARVILDYGNWTKSMTVREMLQRYGTEAHRGVFGEDFWTKQLLDGLVSSGVLDTENVVITDMRFLNETQATKDAGGFTVLIDRPATDDGDTHASEVLPPDDLIDFTVENDSSIADLYRVLDFMVEEFRERDRIAFDALAETEGV
jgi:hypothetical protein